MFKITSQRCFITGVKKGNLKERINYYNSYNAKFEVDKESETIRSDAWGVVRSYYKKQFENMCKDAGFEVVEVVDLGRIGFGIELKKYK